MRSADVCEIRVLLPEALVLTGFDASLFTSFKCIGYVISYYKVIRLLSVFVNFLLLPILLLLCYFN